MKKLLMLILGGILAAVMPLAAGLVMSDSLSDEMALEIETEVVDGYKWKYRINGDVAEITSGQWRERAISPLPTGAVTVPSVLGGKPVTSIGEWAFYNCSRLTSVTIPNGVTSIEEYVFDRCSGLTSVTIPNSVTRVNEYAFTGCGAAIYDTTTIPGVKLVDGWAISTTGSLSGALDLTGCRGIADNAFRLCFGITSVTIPPSVKSIGYSAFEYCYGLTSVTIPPSVKSIGYSAFEGCDELRAVYISDLAAWLKISFFGYRSNPVRLAGHLYLNGKEVTDVVVPDGITSIDYGLFTGWDGLKSVTLPSSVRNIEDEAFYSCDGLTSVTIANGVTNIDDYAFYGCKELRSLVVPASVKSIGISAFAECHNLQSITLPTWCKKIKAYYDDDGEDEPEYELSDKTVNKRGWYPVNFVFYAFVDHDIEDDASWLNYKKIVAQETRGMKITYKDVKGGAGGGAVPEAWQKARTLKGKATRALANPVVGIFELKCGKASKQGVAKVSATLTGLDGKKKSYKAQSVDVTGKAATVNFDGLSVAIDGDSFSGGEGLPGGLSVSAANVGGDWTRDGAKVYVDATGADLPAGTVAEVLPDGEPVIAKGGKWAFNKAAGVKLSKDKTSAERDTSKGKTNLSGLKLTYTPKTGLFKGSFKVYALEGAAGAKKLKKYTVAVTGVVVDGKGVGQAAIKRPAAGPWAVAVE